MDGRAAIFETLSEMLCPVLGEALVYEPARFCPYGHENWDEECVGIESQIHEVCVTCAINANEDLRIDDPRWDDPAWHPEWRIARGEPVDWDDAGIFWRLWDRWLAATKCMVELKAWTDGKLQWASVTDQCHT